jgi:HK97 family phage portal protein
MIWPFRKKAAIPGQLSQPSDDRGWFTVFESFAGAFQQDIKVDRDQILAYHAIFSCITLIASDISKLALKLVQNKNGIWSDIPKGNYSVLDKPNHYQNRIQFFESWINSKLSRGNTYVLKGRDEKGIVRRLYVLHPDLVTVLVSDSGEVFYRLSKDNMSGIENQITVPASEIIHDRFNCLHHPLIGLSPIFASGISAVQGMNIQKNSALFFQNMSRPSGVLTAPGEIKPETAKRLKTDWESLYSGDNIGKTAVLGDDLKYIALSVNAEQSQMVEQLKMTAEIVCSTFHVPKYKVVGDAPSYNNIDALEQGYYSQCLQVHLEAIELCLDEGLDMPPNVGCEFDLDGLIRMDSKTQITALGEAVGKTIMTPNEARKKMNLPATAGGDALYLQQQNYSLEALAKRDAGDDPFGKAAAAPPSETPPATVPPEDNNKDYSSGVVAFIRKLK